MDFPEELKYSKEHVWVRVEGNSAVIGITDFAQEGGTLGIIVRFQRFEAAVRLIQHIRNEKASRGGQ